MKTLRLLGQAAYWLILAGLASVAIFVAASVFNLPGGYKLFTVQSGSMAPVIPMGSLIAVRPADEYGVGEVITFKTGGAPTTHRINAVNNGVFTTKGDANDAPDPEPVRLENIIGRVIFSVPYLGFPVAFAKSREGFMLLVVIPATIIIYSEILNIKNEIIKLKTQKKSKKPKKK